MGQRPQKILLVLLNLFLIASIGCRAQDFNQETVTDVSEEVEKAAEVVTEKIVPVNVESDLVEVETVIKDENYVQPNVDVEETDVEKKVEPMASEAMDSAPVLAAAEEVPVLSKSGSSPPRSGAYVMDSGVMPARIDDGYAELDGRRAPSTSYNNNGQPYVITESRLRTIRERFLYPFYDQGGDEDIGDFQKDIHSSTPQIHKNFNFQLPFFGFRFNYTRISLNGYLEFSDPPSHYTYPLTFPVKDWPKENDPSFIGIFFSKCRIGGVRNEDIDQRRAGVYFRMERDLQTRTDPLGVEMKERITWDLRTGVIGADTFLPKHLVIVTWKNVSFAGGIDNSLYKTNSFQLVLATDEVYTYAIFNYADLQWSSHTEAGGDTTGGEGGTPAYIGFNAGNGTQSYEYKPYSQASILRDLTGRGYGNNKDGRHIFRIDEKILVGSCNKDIDAANLPLMFAPESGNMLGGTIVNVTGPCFDEKDRVICRFDTEDVVGTYMGKNIFTCVQPPLMAEGYVRFEIAVNTENYKWKGRYFVETPATATEKIFFETNDVHEKYPSEIRITWDKKNLTINEARNVMISLWGYRETTIRPEFQYINSIELNAPNSGEYVIHPAQYRIRDDILTNDLQFGFIQINLTQTGEDRGFSPVLWSKPIPLGWYFAPQWERLYGVKWPERMCNNWLRSDRFLKNFAANLPLCPCTLEQALLDKGRFMPDFDCDKDANPKCFYNKGAMHCVKTAIPSEEGAGQQCCYDKNDYLMLSYDQQWGSRPQRSHNLGFLPWNEANKVPSLSNWYHDQSPYYLCCMWQEEQAIGCETFRFERRPSQDCVSYQAPGVASVFGDPHIVTFDDNRYTFNGKGEFVLVRTDVPNLKLDVQARFEQSPSNMYGPVMATQLTSVVAAGNNSAVIEVRLRPSYAQWRYRLDVFANGKRVFFDRKSLKVQHFPGVVVYTPTYILNQSEVVMMFQSGAGVEVIENQGFMSTRVYLPWTYINKTRGLFGNWSWDGNDDFIKPDGQSIPLNLNDFKNIHDEFGKHWMLSDRAVTGKGAALFTREFGRTASYYTNETFLPNFIKEPRDFLPPNRTIDINRATELCGQSYQCRYDYGMTLNRDMAHFTKNYYDSIVNIKEVNSKRVISCGVLETPRFGRKSNFFFVPDTKVTFECNKNFVLVGDQRRTCLPEGRWDVPQYGYTECLRTQEYSSRQAGMTFGIILIVILPILFVLACVWFYCVKRKKDGNSPAFMEKIDSRSRSNSRANLKAASMGNLVDTYKSDPYQSPYTRQQSEPHLTRDDSDTMRKMGTFRPDDDEPVKMIVDDQNDLDGQNGLDGKKGLDGQNGADGKSTENISPKQSISSRFTLPKNRRSYDNTYRTHEPLVGHPNSEFPEKPWDPVENEVLSSGSNDGSDLTNDTLSRPAKDFTFISSNRPKQYGRRRQRKPAEDSGISTQGSREGPLFVDYNPRYDDQESTLSSQYSPIGSDAYSPQMSPVDGANSSKPAFYPNNKFSIPEEPQPTLSSFSLPLKKGKSTDALKENKPATQDPLAQGELRTFSSRTTMV